MHKHVFAVLAIGLIAQPGPATAAPEPTRGSQQVDLKSYADPDSEDAVALIKQMQQEIYANQQKLVGLQFQQTYGERIDMQFVWYPSGRETVPGYVFRARDRMGAGSAAQPAVVMVHGGIHGSLSTEWLPFIAELADRGYAVMVPEYRGSRGYGGEIYKNDYAVTDVADVIAAGEYLKSKSWVDGSRMAVAGRSRGGMVTLLTIQQAPQLFRAAVDSVGLADMVAYMSYKPDYRRRQIAEENPSYKGKLPSEDLQVYMRSSPLNSMDRVETPILILATTGDQVVPHELHSGRVIDALKARGKVFDSKIYENAPGGHQFELADTPEARDAQERIFAWLAKYLSP